MLESLLSNRTVSVLWEALPRILSAGLTMTIPLTLVSFTLAMVLAVAVALVQYARVPVLSQLARFYIWVIRGTPLLVQLFIIFYGLPSVGIMLDAFPAAVIAFAFNEGAYCAETMRGALESVPQGQLEAGCCVGMSWWHYAVACILSQWKEEVNREKESLTQRLIEEGRNNTIIGNLFSQWKKRPRPEEKVTGILNEIEEKNREIMTLSEQMNDLVEQAGIRQRIQRYRDHLDESGGISG